MITISQKERDFIDEIIGQATKDRIKLMASALDGDVIETDFEIKKFDPNYSLFSSPSFIQNLTFALMNDGYYVHYFGIQGEVGIPFSVGGKRGVKFSVSSMV